MLYTIAVILLVLWLLGLVSGYAIGAFHSRVACHRGGVVAGRITERSPGRVNWAAVGRVTSKAGEAIRRLRRS